MLQFPRKEKEKKGRRDGREKKGRKEGEQGFGTEWDGTSRKKKDLCKKKQKCLACYQEEEQFIEPFQLKSSITVDFGVKVL